MGPHRGHRLPGPSRLALGRGHHRHRHHPHRCRHRLDSHASRNGVLPQRPAAHVVQRGLQVAVPQRLQTPRAPQGDPGDGRTRRLAARDNGGEGSAGPSLQRDGGAAGQRHQRHADLLAARPRADCHRLADAVGAPPQHRHARAHSVADRHPALLLARQGQEKEEEGRGGRHCAQAHRAAAADDDLAPRVQCLPALALKHQHAHRPRRHGRLPP